ncbi:hypothetical protein J2W39_006514 [Variovorax paradoxus]|uniref:Uncharacterized protein n=1 Tax=Variovorax paradoxus TaxID=34073 RepID=A0AAW8EQ44_VARPD|nr:hypothetical protein [Variovorax paradoxus]MDP9975226.1 hypothetical protein [Variovorax paradoxus]
MYAYAGQDVSSIAIRKMQQTERTDRFSSAKVTFLKSISQSVPTFVGSWLGGRCARLVASKAVLTAEKAIFFRGAAGDLFRQISETHERPPEALLEEIDSFTAVLTDATFRCSSIIPQLRMRNPASQVADAFEQVIAALEDLRSSVSVLRTVATGGSLPGFVFPFAGTESWEGALKHQRDVFSAVRATVRSGDTTDIDPELLALADEAISASDARNLATDAEWSRRLSGDRLH